jgi:cell division protein FtsZ
MKGAKGVIISITGGEDMRLMEVDEAASHIKELVDPDANIIWGSAFNNDLGGKIRVSVVATGIEAEAAIQPTQGKVFSFPTAGRPIVTPPSPAATPAPESRVEVETLDLTDDDEATDELLLGNEDILADPVMGTPIAPPADEEAEIEPIEEAKPAAAAGGTLFERMSNIARGAAQAKVEEEPVPGFRREPLDIPRFLNRQNNQ